MVLAWSGPGLELANLLLSKDGLFQVAGSSRTPLAPIHGRWPRTAAVRVTFTNYIHQLVGKLKPTAPAGPDARAADPPEPAQA